MSPKYIRVLEILWFWSKILADPLLEIINGSIEAGYFPAERKQALVTPMLKKGSAEQKEIYRPVSCLTAGSKLLERIVCDQVHEFFKANDLLPKNQHGFRSRRSTMTALHGQTCKKI